MQNRVGHGWKHRCRGFRFGSCRRRRRDEVAQRLKRAVEDQANAQPRSEEHRNPGNCRELGNAVIGAEADLPRRTIADHQHENDDSNHGEIEEPAEVFHDPALHGRSHQVQIARRENGPDQDRG
ncbi:hypothetical protein D3C74_380430 [compost metagenome]